MDNIVILTNHQEICKIAREIYYAYTANPEAWKHGFNYADCLSEAETIHNLEKERQTRVLEFPEKE